MGREKSQNTEFKPVIWWTYYLFDLTKILCLKY